MAAGLCRPLPGPAPELRRDADAHRRPPHDQPRDREPGLALGPAAWFITQQVSYDLASKPCGFVPPTVMLLVNLLGLAAVAAGAALCWRSWRLPGGRPAACVTRRAQLRSRPGLHALLLFAVTIVWQGLATFFYTGCER